MMEGEKPFLESGIKGSTNGISEAQQTNVNRKRIIGSRKLLADSNSNGNFSVEKQSVVGNQNIINKGLSGKHGRDEILINANKPIIRRSRKNLPRKLISDEEVHSQPPKPTKRKKSRVKRKVRMKRYGCDICGKMFFREDVLKSHYHSHAGSKRFKCEVCGKEYCWLTSFQNHLLTHGGDAPYKCSECGKVLCNKTSLKSHVIRIHTKAERAFACDVCDRKFLNKYELKYHKADHDGRRRFSCDLCDKTLSTKGDLAKHRLLHTGERPYSCPVCARGYIRKTQLEEHMRLHTDGYSYQCEVCGKQYSSRRSLQRHILIHSDTRPYKCNQCEKAFKCRSALASHKDSHLGIKRHVCEHCGKAFLSEPNMHKHKKRHLGIKTEVCVLCSKAFITKQELRAHMRSHTREPRPSKKSKVNSSIPISDCDDQFLNRETFLSSEAISDQSSQSHTDAKIALLPISEEVSDADNCSESNTAIVYINAETRVKIENEEA